MEWNQWGTVSLSEREGWTQEGMCFCQGGADPGECAHMNGWGNPEGWHSHKSRRRQTQEVLNLSEREWWTQGDALLAEREGADPGRYSPVR